MFALGLLALLAAAMYLLTRHGRPAGHAELSGPPGAVRFEEWVAAGLLTGEQVTAIQAHEATSHAAPDVRHPSVGARPWRMPAVAEPLGYLGAVLATVGLLLVVSRFWPDMGTAGRLGLSGSGAILGVLGGSLVREGRDPASDRLRWALWLAATAAAGLFAGIAAADGLGADAPEPVVLGVAGTVAVVSGLLWRGRERPVQQVTALGGAITAVGAAAALVDWPFGAGLAAALTGGVVLRLGIRRVTSAPPLSAAIGALGVAVGAQLLAVERPALLVLSVALGLGLVGLASLPQLRPQVEHRVAGAVGILVLLQALPSTLAHFAEGAGVATGLVTWAVGAGLLALGVRGLVERGPVVEVVGGLAMLGGAALTGVQSGGLAPVLGIATGLGLLALGAVTGRLRHSALGALALLVDVPWAVGRFFPGEGRVPLLIMVAGILVLGFAVLLARRGDRSPRPPMGGSGLPPVPGRAGGGPEGPPPMRSSARKG